MVWAYAARSRNTIKSNPIFSAIGVAGTFVAILVLYIRRRWRRKEFTGRYFDLTGHSGGASLLGDNKGD